MKKSAFNLLTTAFILGAGATLSVNAYASMNRSKTQSIMEQKQNTPMMKAFLENDIKTFASCAVTEPEESLLEYLELAADQKKTDFVQAIIEHLPADWNADTLADKLVKEGTLHSLNYLLDYTSSDRHSEWLMIAVDNGDADVVKALYKRTPDTDSAALAAKVYQNIKKAKTRFLAARHIQVFEVFRSELTDEFLTELHDQAVKDKLMDFAGYLDRYLAPS